MANWGRHAFSVSSPFVPVGGLREFKQKGKSEFFRHEKFNLIVLLVGIDQKWYKNTKIELRKI
jgi:hypothetical protein